MKIVRVRDVDTKLLTTYQYKVIDFFPQQIKNSKGKTYKLDGLGWKVAHCNEIIRRYSNISDQIGTKCSCPSGLYVFESIEHDMQLVRTEIQQLFRIIEEGPSERNIRQNDPRFLMRVGSEENTILFISPPDVPQPKFLDCMEVIGSYSRDLYRFIAEHRHFCATVMNIGEDEFNATCQLQIIHYPPGRGIKQHIDNLTLFQHTIGPIFTVNIDATPKSFDLFPVISSTKSVPGNAISRTNAQSKTQAGSAVRLVTTEGQITVMDGVSRIMWAHAIPQGNLTDCYTVAFKFPAMSKARVVARSEVYDADIVESVSPSFAADSSTTI